MVVFDPQRRWQAQGVCLDVKEAESLFFAGGSNQVDRPPSPKTKAKWDQAKEICAVCPVLAECRRDTMGEEFGVWGGVDQFERGQLRRRLYRKAKSWSAADRIEWGSILAGMRGAGLTSGQIFRRTGVGFTLADELIDEWEASRPEPGDAPKVIDLPLPEPGHRKDLPFPVRPGECHAWVRHNGMVTDAWYRGQTPDGQWIKVQTWAGRGRSVNKWLPAKDVRIYHPQQVIIMNYRSRPDADDSAGEPSEPLIA